MEKSMDGLEAFGKIVILMACTFFTLSGLFDVGASLLAADGARTAAGGLFANIRFLGGCLQLLVAGVWLRLVFFDW